MSEEYYPVCREGLYTDGGLIGRNPSAIGGTWAWCLVDESGEHIRTNSGLLTNAQNGIPVTNNVTELLAMVEGLEALPDGWHGRIFSNSWVTLQRVFYGARLRNVPDWLVQRLQHIQQSGKMRHMGFALLDGHPTKAELKADIGKRGGLVSEHNVWCDKECNRLAKEYMEQLKGQAHVLPDVV